MQKLVRKIMSVRLQAALQQVHLKAYYEKTMFQNRLTTAKSLKSTLKETPYKFSNKKREPVESQQF